MEIVNSLKNTSIKDSARLYCAIDFDLREVDDPYYFNFCKSRNFSLVTLDDDFMDDKKYPFSKIPGIIRIVSSKSDPQKIDQLLKIFIEFVKYIPLPRVFLGDSKFQISEEGCIMRARDFLSGEVKTMRIVPNRTTDFDVRRYFSYWV